MWNVDKDLFTELANKCGSRYFAAIFIARGARQLGINMPPGVIESKLITWVLTGYQPDIEEYLTHRQQGYVEYQNLATMLEYVMSPEVKKCVIKSYSKSIKLRHLVYLYSSDMPEDLKTRVRVLTRMAWYSD